MHTFAKTLLPLLALLSPTAALAKAPLDGVKVAALITDGTDKTEFTVTRDALLAAGAKVIIVSPREHWVSGKPTLARLGDFPGWGADIPVDVALEDADPKSFDALFIPGGIIGPDLLRLQTKAAPFVAAFFDAQKPVASICHGPTLIVDAGKAQGKRMTSWSSVRRDLENAGVKWEDSEVVVDGELVTSRSPKDLAAFTPAVVKLFAHKR
jgi:protease I